MSATKIVFAFFFCCIGIASFAQTAHVKGIILDKNNQPVESVNISCSGKGTQSDVNGFFEISVPANTTSTIIFTHISLKKTTVRVTLKSNESFEFNPVMSDREEQMGEVIVTGYTTTKVCTVMGTSSVIRTTTYKIKTLLFTSRVF